MGNILKESEYCLNFFDILKVRKIIMVKSNRAVIRVDKKVISKLNICGHVSIKLLNIPENSHQNKIN